MSVPLVSVDPGVHLLGAAMWYRSPGGHWLLDRAALVPFASHPGRALECWVDDFQWDLAIELPQVYRRSRSKAPAADLVDLAAVVGAAEEICPGKVTRYSPFSWKGNVPKPKRKDETYPIEERCRMKLHPEELSCVALPRNWRRCMDVWDAVGIGLRHLRDEGLRS